MNIDQKRPQTALTMIVLALIAAAMYAAIMARFGVMMGR
jgi:hypothetical protein